MYFNKKNKYIYYVPVVILYQKSISAIKYIKKKKNTRFDFIFKQTRIHLDIVTNNKYIHSVVYNKTYLFPKSLKTILMHSADKL